MEAATVTDGRGFPERLRAIATAWADLDEARRIGGTAHALLADAVARAGGNPHLLVRAADLLSDWGRDEEARDLLATGMEPDAPIAPLQFAYARRLLALGDMEGARHWLRGGLLRALPEAARVLELAAIEEGETVEALLRIAAAMPCQNPAGLIATGRRLRDEGKDAFAYAAFAAASRRSSEPGFLAEFAALAARGGIAIADPARDRHVAALAAHAKLARSLDLDALLAAPRDREASDRWVSLDHLSDFLGERIAAGRPFSWIRLSDGEGRFLLHGHAGLRPTLAEAEAKAAARLIWFNWFGQDIDAVDPARLADLTARLDTAIGNADLLGIPSVARFREDPSHVGYCAAVEGHVRHLLGEGGGDARFTEALFTYPLNEADPFLARLLGGRDFLGVVGPHPDLAPRLARHLGIAATASYDIPGETRLGRAREATDRGRHFPEVFDQILATLAVPYPGAVFIVAGGLLGKIYCDRIRALGGVALDVGAIVDAWMGINSRGSSLDGAMGSVLPALANPAPLG